MYRGQGILLWRVCGGNGDPPPPNRQAKSPRLQRGQGHASWQPSNTCHCVGNRINGCALLAARMGRPPLELPSPAGCHGPGQGRIYPHPASGIDRFSVNKVKNVDSDVQVSI